MTTQPPAGSGGNNALKIAGLAVLGLFVLCGLLGTCLLFVTFLLPPGGP
jgi:hypothetical protein